MHATSSTTAETPERRVEWSTPASKQENPAMNAITFNIAANTRLTRAVSKSVQPSGRLTLRVDTGNQSLAAAIDAVKSACAAEEPLRAASTAAEEAVIALRKSDNASAEQIANAKTAEDRAERVWNRAYRVIDKAAAALLKVEVDRPEDVLLKLRVFALAYERKDATRLPDDVEMRAALATVQRDLARLAASAYSPTNKGAGLPQSDGDDDAVARALSEYEEARRAADLANESSDIAHGRLCDAARARDEGGDAVEAHLRKEELEACQSAETAAVERMDEALYALLRTPARTQQQRAQLRRTALQWSDNQDELLLRAFNVLMIGKPDVESTWDGLLDKLTDPGVVGDKLAEAIDQGAAASRDAGLTGPEFVEHLQAILFPGFLIGPDAVRVAWDKTRAELQSQAAA